MIKVLTIEDIHSDLPECQIRNMISAVLGSTRYSDDLPKRNFNKILSDNPSLNYSLGELDHINDIIKYYEEDKKRLYNKLSALTILDIKKWNEYDISDYVIHPDGNYYNFIGTQEERDIFIKELTQS